MMLTYRKSTLALKPRVEFDPSKKSHVVDFARFVKYNGWKDGCSYLLEDPFSDIPTMIRAKIADHVLSKYLEKA